MTDKDNKLAEEILEKNISMRGLIDFGNYSCVGIPYEDALKAMQAYHESKMKEVTDADIVKYAFNYYPDSYNMRVACVNGAKAMRDGEIKHVSRKE